MANIIEGLFLFSYLPKYVLYSNCYFSSFSDDSFDSGEDGAGGPMSKVLLM